jgi:hypothetical protein
MWNFFKRKEKQEDAIEKIAIESCIKEAKKHEKEGYFGIAEDFYQIIADQFPQNEEYQKEIERLKSLQYAKNQEIMDKIRGES